MTKERERDERDLKAMKMLDGGKTYKQIQKELNVSPTIISKLKKELKDD